VILWEFRVRPEEMAPFLRAYGPEGAWAQLFGKAAGYLGTDLLQDERDKLRFVTADRWNSAAAYEDFQWHHQAEYEALNRACQPWFESERRLGVFGVRT
jgi:heme-degrading monooxygenase HmoA